MARQDIELPRSSEPREANIMIREFRHGYVSLVRDSVLPPQAATTTDNLMQVQDGRWAPRWGTDHYGEPAGGQILAAFTYTDEDNSQHIVIVVDDGDYAVVKRSTDDGQTWENCTGPELDNEAEYYGLQINMFLYISNGSNHPIRYDGDTDLHTYEGLDRPDNPSLSKEGLSGSDHTMYYRVTAVNDVGETVASGTDPDFEPASIEVGKERALWTEDDSITLSWSEVPGAKRYSIYGSDDLGIQYYLDSTESTEYVDNGTRVFNTFVEHPDSDTTEGPTFGPMELSDNRIWAVGDPDHPWRVYWGGTGSYQGAFSPHFGGGYVDLEKGGSERPVAVVHYRDGRGNSNATVLTSDPEGNGSIWHINLELQELGDVAYTVPMPVKIVGSTGAVAPKAVAKVKDDIQFLNRRGIFSLRSKPQLLNVLSTDEYSANIRPDIRGLSGSALHKACATTYDAKVFFSVPSGSSENNRIYINDTEQRNWAGPWTFGVRDFLQYTDESGDSKLLAVSTDSDRLMEISEEIEGDFGQAFETTYVSGLLPIDDDLTVHSKIRYAYIALGHPRGVVNFAVFGTDRNDGYVQLAEENIRVDTNANVGIGTTKLGTTKLGGDPDIDVESESTSVVIKRVRINKLVNNIQFRVRTLGRRDWYSLVALQAKGFVVPIRDPSRWDVDRQIIGPEFEDDILLADDGEPIYI